MSTTLTTTIATSSSKKRKQQTDDPIPGPSPKKIKRDKKLKKKKSSLGVAKKDRKIRHCEFNLVRASLSVSLAPVFMSNPRAGVEEMLDSMVMRYIPSLKGVVLLHSNLQFQQSNATIQGDCPFATCHVTFDAMVWSPTVGMQLSGKLNLCSPDHISLLVHRTFNVSIPKHHIPLDQWHFEYGPAENDPQFWNGPNGEEPDADVDTMMMELDERNENREEDTDKSMGKWVRSDTGEKIGGSSGMVTFTLIGTTVANQMLSLVGSLQPDPFSPAHVPHQAPQATKSFVASPSRSPSPHPLQTTLDDDEDNDDELVDALAALSPSRDESQRILELAQDILGEEKSLDPTQKPDENQNQSGAAEDEQSAEAEAEKARKAERKRKRREEKASAKEQLGEGAETPRKKKKKKVKAE